MIIWVVVQTLNLNPLNIFRWTRWWTTEVEQEAEWHQPTPTDQDNQLSVCKNGATISIHAEHISDILTCDLTPKRLLRLKIIYIIKGPRWSLELVSPWQGFLRSQSVQKSPKYLLYNIFTLFSDVINARITLLWLSWTDYLLILRAIQMPCCRHGHVLYDQVLNVIIFGKNPHDAWEILFFFTTI